LPTAQPIPPQGQPVDVQGFTLGRTVVSSGLVLVVCGLAQAADATLSQLHHSAPSSLVTQVHPIVVEDDVLFVSSFASFLLSPDGEQLAPETRRDGTRGCGQGHHHDHKESVECACG
jgi:hypothetical protein